MELTSIQYDDCDFEKVPKYAKKMDTIFQYNGNGIEKNAYLNWRTGFAHTQRGQFVVIGEAFFSSAYNLLQQCLKDNSDKKADSWIFPIMFNMIHGIEVYLKAINAVLSNVLGENKGISEGGHDLKGLCGTAKNLVIKYKNKNKTTTTKQMFQAITLVQKFINNIYEKTDDMTFARYPLAKNKQGYFYIQAFENEVIDMELLKEQMLFVYRMLNFIYEMPELEIDTESMIDYY